MRCHKTSKYNCGGLPEFFAVARSGACCLLWASSSKSCLWSTIFGLNSRYDLEGRGTHTFWLKVGKISSQRDHPRDHEGSLTPIRKASRNLVIGSCRSFQSREGLCSRHNWMGPLRYLFAEGWIEEEIVDSIHHAICNSWVTTFPSALLEEKTDGPTSVRCATNSKLLLTTFSVTLSSYMLLAEWGSQMAQRMDPL